MKIAFISDIHSNLEALEKVLEKIDELKVKKIYCLGDIVGYGANPKECIKILRKKKVECLKGNHDYGIVTMNLSFFNEAAARSLIIQKNFLDEEDLNFLKNLKEKIEFKLKDLKFLLVHGSPFNPIFEYVFPSDIKKDFFKFLDYDVIALGHTHIPFKKFLNSKIVFNPGSVGQPRDGINKASFALFHYEKRDVEFFRVEYDIKKSYKKILSRGLPYFNAQRLYLGI